LSVLSLHSSRIIGAAFWPTREGDAAPDPAACDRDTPTSAEHNMVEEAVREDSKKDDGWTSCSAPTICAGGTRRALAEISALKLCLSCGSDSDRIVQPVIYGDDLPGRRPILPPICADGGHITT
jgi:hypothetical protein